jgi:hypothetical protein
VPGGWRKFQNEELNNLCSLLNIIEVVKWRKTRWTGCVERMGKRHEDNILIGKPEGKTSLGTARRIMG